MCPATVNLSRFTGVTLDDVAIAGRELSDFNHVTNDEVDLNAEGFVVVDVVHLDITLVLSNNY